MARAAQRCCSAVRYAGVEVIADWPGLASNQLFEGRDLRPTLDTRQLLKGVLGAHYDLRNAELNQKIFPDSGAVSARWAADSHRLIQAEFRTGPGLRPVV